MVARSAGDQLTSSGRWSFVICEFVVTLLMYLHSPQLGGAVQRQQAAFNSLNT